MQIDIRMTGPDADEDLTSLREWLQEDQDIRRHARISLKMAEPRSGEMGTAFEVIQLVVGGGFQALNFALAYANWRSSKPRRTQVTIECNGTKVSLADNDPDTVETIIRALN
jgi:hypothetical protein